uniref:Uncharacterized protein n=1 Tax=Tanacetum cinerariifolium TaxID=118510 RepID=A0A6L2MCN6_TANCI|nr:hypothetical protein [Tanacetum cinerariifolium]
MDPILGGKQRGHLLGIVRKVAKVGTSTVFGSQDEGTPFYSQREMNKNQGMSQLATLFPGSTTEVGLTSGTASASRDPSPSGNVDPSSGGSLDGDDDDDEEDV